MMTEEEKIVKFDRKYYNSLMREYGYNPLEFERINFSLKNFSKNDLQRKWLCHQGCDKFAKNLSKKKSIVTTGLGLTGAPHIGTLSQIFRAISLQKAGIPVQMVLGDLEEKICKETSKTGLCTLPVSQALIDPGVLSIDNTKGPIKYENGNYSYCAQVSSDLNYGYWYPVESY